jgi:two-component system chemotaxis response regulator CheB
VKILVTDDSALVRKQLGELLIGAGYSVDFAKNGKEAVEKSATNQYDAITLDINMPVMDGIEALKIIMEQNPTPVLMISSLTTDEADITFLALELGAIDYVAKPGTLNVDIESNKKDILEKLSYISKLPRSKLRRAANKTLNSMNNIKKSPQTVVNDTKLSKILLIGASTGGPTLIENICKSLPSDYPYPVCIVQHMPERFTLSFAQRLNKHSQLNVLESVDGDEIRVGNIYVAKGGNQVHLTKKVSGKVVIKHHINKNNRFFTPSVDELFISATDVFSKNIISILLTGIGDDGADGMVTIKKAGGYTIAESEESAYVFGMPKEAINRGGACDILSFDNILKKVVSYR